MFTIGTKQILLTFIEMNENIFFTLFQISYIMDTIKYPKVKI